MGLSVYILKCENEKYFVGKTEDSIKEIYKKHLDGVICEWTKSYKPIKLVSIISPANESDEDRYTEMYMDKYGIDNVRGGKYTCMNLDDRTIQYINNEVLDEQNFTEELNNHSNKMDMTWDMVNNTTEFTKKDIRKIKKYNNKRSFLSFIKNTFYG